MPATLSLSCSKKIYELLGETYETENKWFKRDAAVATSDYWIPPLNWTTPEDMKETKSEPYKYPAPTFSETIRLLPRLIKHMPTHERMPLDAEISTHSGIILHNFMHAPTEEEGMKHVSDYLEALL